MNCPRDGHRLTPFPFRDGVIASCERCHGMWVPGRLVAAATRSGTLHARMPSDETLAPATVQCPEDHALLREIAHKGVRIDYCPTCRGVWLDAGELAQIRTPSPTGPAGNRKPLLEAGEGLDSAATTALIEFVGTVVIGLFND